MTPKIPKGWRELKAGNGRKVGDRHYMANHNNGKKWHDIALKDGRPAYGRITPDDMELWGPYIRRLKRRAKK